MMREALPKQRSVDLIKLVLHTFYQLLKNILNISFKKFRRIHSPSSGVGGFMFHNDICQILQFFIFNGSGVFLINKFVGFDVG